MSKLLFSLFALMLSAASYAAQPTLVVLVDINCQFCRELNRIDTTIINEAKKAGFDFVYAPIPNDADYSTAWPEKTYYSCVKSASCDESALLKALYDSQDAKKLNTLAEVQVWVEATAKNNHGAVKAVQSVSENNNEYTASVVRAMRLAGAVKLNQFPTFAVVGDGNSPPYQLASDKDAPLSERINTIIKFLKSKQG